MLSIPWLPQRGISWPRLRADGAPGNAPEAELHLDDHRRSSDVRSNASFRVVYVWSSKTGYMAGAAYRSPADTSDASDEDMERSDTAPRQRTRRRRRGREWIPPAAPNSSLQRPCVHNSWDNVRVKKDKATLRCRACQLQWKVDVAELTSGARCEEFSATGKCPAGAGCRLLHVHRFKQSLHKRKQIWGEQVCHGAGRGSDYSEGGTSDGGAAACPRPAPRHADTKRGSSCSDASHSPPPSLSHGFGSVVAAAQAMDDSPGCHTGTSEVSTRVTSAQPVLYTPAQEDTALAAIPLFYFPQRKDSAASQGCCSSNEVPSLLPSPATANGSVTFTLPDGMPSLYSPATSTRELRVQRSSLSDGVRPVLASPSAARRQRGSNSSWLSSDLSMPRTPSVVAISQQQPLQAVPLSGPVSGGAWRRALHVASDPSAHSGVEMSPQGLSSVASASMSPAPAAVCRVPVEAVRRQQTPVAISAPQHHLGAWHERKNSGPPSPSFASRCPTVPQTLPTDTAPSLQPQPQYVVVQAAPTVAQPAVPCVVVQHPTYSFPSPPHYG